MNISDSDLLLMRDVYLNNKGLPLRLLDSYSDVFEMFCNHKREQVSLMTVAEIRESIQKYNESIKVEEDWFAQESL